MGERATTTESISSTPRGKKEGKRERERERERETGWKREKDGVPNKRRELGGRKCGEGRKKGGKGRRGNRDVNYRRKVYFFRVRVRAF